MATHYLRLQSQYRDVDKQSTRNHDTFDTDIVPAQKGAFVYT